MAGSVWKVECTAGEIVAENDVVIILEAMKMETELFAPSAGKISQIRVKEGDTVEEDDVLLVIEAG